MKIQLSKFNFKEKSFTILLFTFFLMFSFGLNQMNAQTPTAVNDNPADIMASTAPVPYEIQVLNNDSFGTDGPNVGSISVTPIPPAIGNVTVDTNFLPNDPTDDTLLFIPAVNYSGPVTIFYEITDSNGDTSTATVSFNVLPAAALSITKTVPALPYNVGDVVTFRLTVTNNGPSNATGIKVVDKLPDGYAFISSDNPADYDAATGLWTIPNLSAVAPNNTATIDIHATINPTGNYRNIAEITEADQDDPNGVVHGNNTPGEIDQDEKTITPFQLSNLITVLTVDNETPNEGDTIVYTVTVKNEGPNDATNAHLIDFLPLGVTYVSNDLGTDYNPLNGFWDIGTIVVGSSKTINITATVSSGTGGTVISNIIDIADIYRNQTDPDLTGDTLQADITVTSTDLVTTKTVANADAALTTYSEGDEIIYTITVNHSSGDDATNVSLTDHLPPGVTFVSSNASLGTYDENTGIWTIGDIASGSALVILEIRAIINSGTGGSIITNTTTVAQGEQSDPTTAGDDLEETITVENESDIVLTKAVNNLTPNAGDTVTYTITVVNNGPALVKNLVVRDPQPAGLTFTSFVPSEGTWDAVNEEWIVGNLATGTSQTLTIEAVVGMSQGGQTITNTATHTQDQTDSSLPSEAEVDITVTSTDLVTTKTVANADAALTTYSEGDEIIYTITVENLGPSDATTVSLKDQLPIGVTYINDDSGGAYDRVNGVWDIGNIANGNLATLNIRATIDAGTAGTTIENITTAAQGDQSEPSPATTVDVLSATITVENETDIVLTKTVDNATPNAGDTIIYTVTVKNNGPLTATNLQITDNLPTGLTFKDAVASNGTWTAPIWFVGNLAPGEEQNIKIEVIVGFSTVVTPTTITNTVSNSQDQIDSNVTLDDEEETITVTSSDLFVRKTVDNVTPNEGGTIVYTIEVENNGPSDATNVNIEDLLPVGVTYVSSAVTQGVYNNGSGLWTIGGLANGVVARLYITATVDSGTSGNTITNTASITSADQSDPNSTNNSASISIVPTANIDLSLAKTVLNNAIAPEIGATITFEIVVSNNGPSKATGVEVRDILPSGYSFVRYSSTKGKYDSTTGLWNVGSIEIGDAEIMLIDVIVLNGGIYDNCARINNSDQTDIDTTNDEDCVIVTPVLIVGVELDLEIEKTVIANNITPQVGTEISFEIRLINTDSVDKGTGIVVTDLLPTGYTFLSYSSTKGAYDVGTGEWSVGSIVAGDTEVLIIDVLVNPLGDYENCVNITTSNQILTTTSITNSCITTTPINVIDLELTKEVALSPGSEGSVSTTDILQPYAENNVDFTITINNNGPSEATGVQILDLLPSGYEFISSSVTIGTYNEVSGIWDVGDIANGSSETLTITAFVNPIGDWLNTAEVVAVNEFDLDSSPNNAVLLEDDMAQIATLPIVSLNIPEGFTPNGDGINDVFEIEHLQILYPNFSMKIVNRYGNIVYEYKHNGDAFQTPLWWNGVSNGRMNLSNDQLPTGTYFFTIYFNNNERKPQTGWVYLRK